MKSNAPEFEVRCSRCDVSFPPGTRRCVHCGGPTAKPTQQTSGSWTAPDMKQWANASGAPMRPASEPEPQPDAVGMGAARDVFTGHGIPSVDDEVGEEAGAPMGKTLLRVFGSLIWIVVVIAFTLIQRCREQ